MAIAQFPAAAGLRGKPASTSPKKLTHWHRLHVGPGCWFLGTACCRPAHSSDAVLESAGVSTGGDGFCTVHEPADRGCADDGATDDFSLPAEGIVWVDDDGDCLVSDRNELEAQDGGFGFEEYGRLLGT